MTTAPKFRRKNSCPDGWLNAGAKVPIRLTVRQEEYCGQAIDIHRFCYNLAVRTHRFCRRNRLTWPSWMDISKAFNACKREDFPFVTQVLGLKLKPRWDFHLQPAETQLGWPQSILEPTPRAGSDIVV